MIMVHNSLLRGVSLALLIASLLLAACSSGGRQAAESLATASRSEDAPSPIPSATGALAPAVAPVEATATEEPAEKGAGDADPAAIEEASTDIVAKFVIVPEESAASYSIDEVFLSDDNALVTAVGVTSEVQGGMTLNYDDPSVSKFEQFAVDVSTLTSDRSRRDRAIRRQWLESATYPLATFDVSEMLGFPPDPEEGVPLSFQLVGDMKVKETTREVVWDVAATLDGDRLSGTATLETFLADFDIPVPSIAGILRVTDGIVLNLEFVMERIEE